MVSKLKWAALTVASSVVFSSSALADEGKQGQRINQGQSSNSSAGVQNSQLDSTNNFIRNSVYEGNGYGVNTDGLGACKGQSTTQLDIYADRVNNEEFSSSTVFGANLSLDLGGSRKVEKACAQQAQAQAIRALVLSQRTSAESCALYANNGLNIQALADSLSNAQAAENQEILELYSDEEIKGLKKAAHMCTFLMQS